MIHEAMPFNVGCRFADCILAQRVTEVRLRPLHIPQLRMTNKRGCGKRQSTEFCNPRCSSICGESANQRQRRMIQLVWTRIFDGWCRQMAGRSGVNHRLPSDAPALRDRKKSALLRTSRIVLGVFPKPKNLSKRLTSIGQHDSSIQTSLIAPTFSTSRLARMYRGSCIANPVVGGSTCNTMREIRDSKEGGEA
jgi:hypothetical protein